MSFTLAQIQADAKTKLAAKYGVDESKIEYEWTYLSTPEMNDPKATLVFGKLIMSVRPDDKPAARVEVGVFKKKSSDEYDYAAKDATAESLNAPIAEEAIEKAASVWAAGQSAKHVEVLNVNPYNKTCKILAYVGDPIAVKTYVVYREGGVTKAKEVV